MTAETTRRASRLAAIAAATAALSLCLAEEPCRASSKDECIEAHGRGQDLRERGQLGQARRAFLACAQSSCPAIVQEDCARFEQEIGQLVPSVSFGARDSRSADLPDTAVYVDGALVADRLDDGKARDIDPGKHAIRFVHRGRAVTLNVMISEGERGRALVATFDAPAPPGAVPQAPASQPSPPRASRSGLPLIIAGAGAAAMATSAVLIAVGLHEVPSNCTLSPRQCEAPPGDPAFGSAHRGVSIVNVGLGVGAGGVAVLGGGLLWYLLEPSHASAEASGGAALAPWLGTRSAGVSMSTRF